MAGELGFDYSIVRPGQLPETEGKEDNPAKSMVSVKQGDSEAGAVGLASVAATIVQVCVYTVKEYARLSRVLCRDLR